MNPPREQGRNAFLHAAQAMVSRGQLAEVERATRLVLGADPSFTEAHFLLAFLLSHDSRWADAEPHLERVVRDEPDRADARYALAIAKKMLGKAESSLELLESLTEVRSPNPSVLAELGIAYLTVGRAAPAIQALSRASQLGVRTAELFHHLGAAYALNDQLAESRDAFREALKLDPRSLDSRIGLVQQLVRLSQTDEAMHAIDSGLALEPDSAPLLNLKASALAQSGDAEAAESTYLRAIELEPEAIHSYVIWLQEQGRFDDSKALLSRSIVMNPCQGAAYYRLTEVKCFEIDGRPLFDFAEVANDGPQMPLEERMFLDYALGRLHEHRRDFESAMRHYDLANQAAFKRFNAGRPLDRDLEISITDRRIRTRWSRSQSAANGSDQPIFIVGMIRSGTTLLDQMLSSHPSVSAAGELKFWIAEADRLAQRDHAYIEDPELSPTQAEAIASRYLAQLQGAGGSSRWITDKMPLNYAYVGLIHHIFPKAKFIHVRRHPVDTCLSIYATHFGLGPRWAYDQANIAFNYREYIRLMAHWREHIPANQFLDVDYESLVKEPEPTLRNLLEFCEIPWHDNCLRHESNETAIRTPSRWQARQPIYGTSMQRWLNFEPFLGDFRGLLKISSTAQ